MNLPVWPHNLSHDTLAPFVSLQPAQKRGNVGERENGGKLVKKLFCSEYIRAVSITSGMRYKSYTVKNKMAREHHGSFIKPSE